MPTGTHTVQTLPLNDITCAYIAATDAHCPSCGYTLRGLQDPRCPECGLALELTLLGRRGNSPKDHPVFTTTFTIGSVAFAVVWGVIALALALGTASAIARGDPRLWQWALAAVASVIGCVLALAPASWIPTLIARATATRPRLLKAAAGSGTLLIGLALHVAAIYTLLAYAVP